jgi:septum formation protein
LIQYVKKKLSNYDIILASQSPRRINFFNELNIKFKSLKLDFDESYPNNLIAEQITDFIVNKKASYYSDLLNKNTVVITSDTIVWLNGKAIGKPKNNENAKEILQTLSGKTHKVITSFCIKTLESKKIVNDITEVTFKQLTEKEIDFYINHNKVLDKAGAYGIQDWIGYIGITNINGTYNNVMGLPTHLLYKELMNL